MEFLKIAKVFAEEYYAIPDYQRDYEWKNDQNATLIDDIFSLMNDSYDNTHFFGALVTIPYEDNTGVDKSIEFDDYGINSDSVKHIVDGQQRLTSFSILITALKRIILQDMTVGKLKVLKALTKKSVL